ncbi:hypothetical protein LTSEMIS_5954, partial [Salmonella enterica subsp. enterica serovar Mississippi str. A4-633]
TRYAAPNGTAPVANDTHVAEVISAPQANDTTFTDEDLA